MKIYSSKYPSLHSANMTLVYDPVKNVLDPDINLKVCTRTANFGIGILLNCFRLQHPVYPTYPPWPSRLILMFLISQDPNLPRITCFTYQACVSTMSPDDIHLRKRKLKPCLHVGSLSPTNIPYQRGDAFSRFKLCPEVGLVINFQLIL